MEHADLDSLINSAWDVGVVVCELRPTRQSVSETDDYDLTCSLSDLPRFVEVLFNIAKEQSFSFEIAQRKFAKTVIYVYAYDSQIKRKIEIWHALRLRRSGTDYSHVLLPSQLAAGFYGRFKVSPLWRLVILPVLFLARMSVGSNLDADDVRRVRLFLEGLDKVPSDLGAKNCVKSMEEQLLRLLVSGCMTTEIKEVVFSHLNTLGMAPKPFRFLVARELLYLRRRLVSKRVENWVPFCGVDGSGKSSLVQKLRSMEGGSDFGFQKFRKLFQNSFLFKMFYYPNRLLNRKHDKKVSEHRLGWWAVISARVRMPKFKNKWVLSDRWFYDYLVRDVKFTKREPRPLGSGVIRFLGYFIPRPPALVVIFCKQQSLDARKGEMDAPAVSLVEKVYVEQVVNANLYPVLFCNTEQGIDCCALQVQSLLNFVASRPPRTLSRVLAKPSSD